MRHWSFYDVNTGMFTGGIFSADSEQHLALNTPAGCAAREGRYDHLSQRIDLDTEQVIDYQPPPPDADHEWNAQARRWEKREAVLVWEHERTAAQLRLLELDMKRSRALSDYALRPNERSGIDQKLPRERLAEIEAEAESLRAIVNAPKPP